MAAAERSGGGVVKHLVIVQFKEDVTPERLDGLICGYGGLVDKVSSMKAFHWVTDVSIENMHQGFTHVFESTFESTERASGIEALSHCSIAAWTRRHRRRRHLDSTGDHPLQHQKQQSLLAASDNLPLLILQPLPLLILRFIPLSYWIWMLAGLLLFACAATVLFAIHIQMYSVVWLLWSHT